MASSRRRRLLAQRRLAEPETLGRAAEVSLFGDLLEVFDVTQFHGDNCNSSAHEAGAIAGVEKPVNFATIHRKAAMRKLVAGIALIGFSGPHSMARPRTIRPVP